MAAKQQQILEEVCSNQEYIDLMTTLYERLEDSQIADNKKPFTYRVILLFYNGCDAFRDF